MRYQIGRAYPFIHIRRQLVKDLLTDAPRYVSVGELPNIIDMQAYRMRCDEHHKVRNAYADEDSPASEDGFVFASISQMPLPGVRWFNQYPRCRNEQLSDTMNYVLSPEYTGRTEEQKRVILDQPFRYLFCAETYLAHVVSGVAQLNTQPARDEKAIASLAQHALKVRDLIEQVMQRKVCLLELMDLQSKTPEDAMTGIFTTGYEDEPHTNVDRLWGYVKAETITDEMLASLAALRTA